MKMRLLATTIVRVIEDIYPDVYLEFVFSGNLTIDDVVIQILVECSKYAYDNLSEKHSLRYYLKANTFNEDDERMLIQRTVKYINEHRQKIYTHYYERVDDKIIEGLKMPIFRDRKDKLQGYSFNSFQFWEINNVHDMKLVKYIVEKRISSKNTTLDTFRDLSNEYDEFFNHTIHSNENNKDIFNYLSIFVLEWKYSFDFLYEISSEIEKNKIENTDNLKKRIVPFCSSIQFNSLLTLFNKDYYSASYIGESRMLVQRRKFIHDIIYASDADFNDEIKQFQEGLYIVGDILLRMTYEKTPLKEWFLKNTKIDDWISVFDEYGIFQVYVPNKKWTKKKVRHMKDIYKSISIDYKKS